MKDLSLVLNNSSQYWKGTFSDFGKNFCDCTRGEILDGEDIEPLINNCIEVPVQSKVEENQNYNATLPVKNNFHFQVDNLIINENIINKTTNLYEQNIINNQYNNIQGSKFNKRSWSKEEDKQLIGLVASFYKRNWKKISNSIGNKTPQQCAYRYDKLMKLETTKKWNRNDDILIMELIDILGMNWVKISENLKNGRSPQEIRERYDKKLNPNLKRCNFTKEEDNLIIELHHKYRNQWNKISKVFKDRSAIMIKSRFYSFLKKPNNSEISDNFSDIISIPLEADSNILMSMQPTKSPSVGIEKQNSMRILNDASNIISDTTILKNYEDFYFKTERESELYFKEIESEYNSVGLMNNAFLNMKFEEENMRLLLSIENECEISELNRYYEIKNSNSKISESEKSNNSETKLTYSKQSSRRSKYSSEMIIDDIEVNDIPKDLIQLETDSPYDEEENKHNDNFIVQFGNAFRTQKCNFNDIADDGLANNQHSQHFVNDNNFLKNKNKNDKQINNNDLLIKQYHMLEEVFQKVQDVSLNHLIILNSYETNFKLITLIQKLDEKRDVLSLNLKKMKTEYFNSITTYPQISSNNIQTSLTTQIEILIELIKTTKLKINLIAQNSNYNIVI